MPVTARAFIKASILYLGLGALLGALFFLNRWLPVGPALAALRVSHVQFLVTGWLTQLILGVAWWLFPPLDIGLRAKGAGPVRRGQAQRGSERLFWLTFATLNLGVLLRAIFEPIYTWTGEPLFLVLVGLSGPLLLVAALAFVVNMWRRVRALGRDR
ncbi:MAG: hypothetical protein PVF47_14950 [Anaerolineae bacterium]